MGRQLPGSLSPSAISSFTDCPLAFRFSYLDRLPQPPSAPASKGTLVHRALEILMNRPPTERKLDVALGDLDVARAELAEHPEFADLDLDEAGWRSFYTHAETLVRKYFDLEDPTTVHPVGLELKLQAEIGDVRLRGIIDRLDFNAATGEFTVVDYKTGSVPGERFENARLGGVHVYSLLVEEVFGVRPKTVQLYYLSKPEVIIAETSEQKTRGVAKKAGALWNAIARACAKDDFRPNPGKLCDWCAYKPYCPAFGGDPAEAEELRGPGSVIAPALPLGV